MGIGDTILTDRGPARVVGMEWGRPVVQSVSSGWESLTDDNRQELPLQDQLFDTQVSIGGLKKTIEEV